MERKLPPALEEDKYHPGLVRTSDLLDWLYGKNRHISGEGVMHFGAPGLVERVRMAANQTASRRTGTYVLRPSDVFEALRAELGEP